MQMPEIDFSSLEIREIGTWPLVLRIIIIFTASVLTIIAVYFFIIASYMQKLDTQKSQLLEKHKEFKEKYNMAVNLDSYKQQMLEMQGMYTEYLKALPASSDIPSLVDVISRLGENNNLKFDSIKIGNAKIASDFYMVLPIDFIITGVYGNIGKFISDLSKLPRIVTIEDFSIKPVVEGKNNNIPGLLVMNLSIKTYWVASASDQAPVTSNQGANKNMTVTPPGKTSIGISPRIPGAPAGPSVAPKPGGL